jgi:hypothetical protein
MGLRVEGVVVWRVRAAGSGMDGKRDEKATWREAEAGPLRAEASSGCRVTRQTLRKFGSSYRRWSVGGRWLLQGQRDRSGRKTAACRAACHWQNGGGCCIFARSLAARARWTSPHSRCWVCASGPPARRRSGREPLRWPPNCRASLSTWRIW